MREIEKHIKDKSLKKVYLLFGEEVFLRKRCEALIKENCVDKQFEMMNSVVFYNGVDIDRLISACETIPFMAEKRLVLVRYSGAFVEGKKELSNAINNFLPNLPETTVLVFVEEKVDKRLSLYKTVNKLGYAAEFSSLKEKDLVSWVEEFSEGNISSGAAIYLIRTVGESLEILGEEIKKLRAYCGDKNSITKKAIDEIATKSVNAQVFDMVGYIGKKNTALAIKQYNELLALKEAPIKILAIISRQFRLILQCKYLQRSGATNAEIASKLNIRSFFLQEYLDQGKNFTIPELIGALESCLECDKKIKGGKLIDRVAVEMLIMKYSDKEKDDKK